MKIKTDIETYRGREYWIAWDDDSYDGADESCPVGTGESKQDAIDDLIEGTT